MLSYANLKLALQPLGKNLLITSCLFMASYFRTVTLRRGHRQKRIPVADQLLYGMRDPPTWVDETGFVSHRSSCSSAITDRDVDYP